MASLQDKMAALQAEMAALQTTIDSPWTESFRKSWGEVQRAQKEAAADTTCDKQVQGFYESCLNAFAEVGKEYNIEQPKTRNRKKKGEEAEPEE